MAREISHLFRYMRGYFRKALRSNKSVITMDDYTYLVCLLRIPMMTKTELNNLNVMEKTSGTEVINRLLRRGLIEQHVNEEDHRSFYVSITEKGREEVVKLFPELKKIVTIFFSGSLYRRKLYCISCIRGLRTAIRCSFWSIEMRISRNFTAESMRRWQGRLLPQNRRVRRLLLSASPRG